jgi:hypothetical protein
MLMVRTAPPDGAENRERRERISISGHGIRVMNRVALSP